MARKARVSKDKPKSPEVRAFKASSEVESFYSFIHENDLRREAKILMEAVLKSIPKKRKKSSKVLH